MTFKVSKAKRILSNLDYFKAERMRGYRIGALKRSIKRAEDYLKAKAQKTGLYENFGQKEVGELQDAYSDLKWGTPKEREAYDEILKFEKWASTYNLGTITKDGVTYYKYM